MALPKSGGWLATILCDHTGNCWEPRLIAGHCHVQYRAFGCTPHTVCSLIQCSALLKTTSISVHPTACLSVVNSRVKTPWTKEVPMQTLRDKRRNQKFTKWCQTLQPSMNKVPSLFNMEYNNFFPPKIKLDVHASLFSIVFSFQLKIKEGVYNCLLSLITSLRSILFKFLWEIL